MNVNDRFLTDDELAAMLTPDKLGIIGTVNPPRVGCRLFCVLLEHRHFSPRDQHLNDQFEMNLVRGPEEIDFYLIIVPMSCRQKVEEVATECNLRLADGVPHILGGEKVWDFPVNKPNVFTLENKEGSFVYMNNEKLYQAALEVEQKKCDTVFANFDRGL